MRDAAPKTKAQRANTKKPRQRKAPRRSQRQVVCQICHEQFDEITAEHLRTHGFTLTRYRRAFSTHTRAPRTSTAGSPTPADDPNHRHTVATIAERIIHDPEVIREMAGEVAEAIFGSSLRDALRMSLVSVLSERLKAHGEATAALAQVRAELAAPWRVTQGGPNGQPTPTKDLLAMASVLGQEVKTGEDLLLKTVKLAIEEWRSHKGVAAIEGGLPDRFSGDGEVLPVPATLTSSDRETIRTLWGMFDKAIDAKKDLVVDVTPRNGTSSADDSGRHHADGSDADPDDPQDSSPEDNGSTPLVGADEPF